MPNFPAKSLGIKGLPNTAEARLIEFLPRSTERPENLLLDLPQSMSKIATESPLASQPDPEIGSGLILLTVAAENHRDAPAFDAVKTWVSAAPSPATAGNNVVNMMTLQGTKAIWKGTRFAIFAPSERLENVRRSLVENAFYDFELASVESKLRLDWPRLEADFPYSFEVRKPSRKRRKQLQERFETVQTLRVRQMRIAAKVNCPHLHPPTLASQFSERFRERTQLEHRYEVLNHQLEVFEENYQLCAQRTNDSLHSKKSNRLEWIIIVLLILQVVLYGIEFLQFDNYVRSFLPWQNNF